MATTAERLGRASFFETLLNRRSRRFGLGMKMTTGPLAFASRFPAHPLSEDEEAALAFSAAGITGHALGDLCYAQGQGGNIMNGFVGRAVGSGDGIQAVALFVINDKGASLVRRPRDFNASELGELIQLAQGRKLTDVYQRSRVQVKQQRVAPPATPLFNINCNQWSVHAPGTTYFLPVNDVTFLYINGLLEIFNEDTRAFVLDERASFRPAGLGGFAKSGGGHLENDPKAGRVATIELIERMVTQFVTIEQGMMLQNLALMTQALGLGGFPNFANHEFAWFQALGFRMNEMPASCYLGAGPVVSLAMNLLNRNSLVPYPVGLEVNGKVLLKAYCPPYFSSMREAVEAVVKAKSAAFEAAGKNGAWLQGANVVRDVPKISQATVNATVAYCEYVWARYGRFPAYLAPFGTVAGFQACHLDAEFYDKHYKPEALAKEQREDFQECAKV
jgi:hypothetical protein